MKKLAAVVALLCVFGLGMSFALLGALKVHLVPHLGITDAQFGQLGSTFMFACLIMSLVTGLLCDKLGYKPIAILGFVVTAVCIFLLSRATSYSMAMVACILLGIGAMCCNTAGNTLIPVVLFGGKNPAAASNFGNIFFGLGFFITPLLTGLLFNSNPGAYSTNVTVLAVIVLLPVILAIIAEYPVSSAGFQFSQAAGLLGQIAVWVSALALFFYIALEVSMGTWVSSYASEVLKKTPNITEDAVKAKANYMMSMFAIAMMVGRLIASQIPAITRVGDKVVAGMGLLAAIVLFIMTKSGSVGLAWVLVALIGLACAPCFPTIVGVTFSKFDPKVYGSVFGIIFAVGLAGAVFFVQLIGKIAAGAGGSVQSGLQVLIGVAVALIVLALLMGITKAKGDVAAKQ
ncbi:MAG: MFS transporter [Candidatus Sumerlaeia bacterium]|nr:MFS transporter [Candidatus Sumerlaeia bacterium]